MSDKLQQVIIELEKLSTDLREVKIVADMEFQATRLDKQIRKLKELGDRPAPAIHGGGTGDD